LGGDWEAVDKLLSSGLKRKLDPALIDMIRVRFAGGHGGYPIIGSPDTVAAMLADLHRAGFTGYCFSFVNYLSELPYFADEVLPRLERLGVRGKRLEATTP
jgi:dimethylsulfone monooxygenase